MLARALLCRGFTALPLVLCNDPVSIGMALVGTVFGVMTVLGAVFALVPGGVSKACQIHWVEYVRFCPQSLGEEQHAPS